MIIVMTDDHNATRAAAGPRRAPAASWTTSPCGSGTRTSSRRPSPCSGAPSARSACGKPSTALGAQRKGVSDAGGL